MWTRALFPSSAGPTIRQTSSWWRPISRRCRARAIVSACRCRGSIASSSTATRPFTAAVIWETPAAGYPNLRPGRANRTRSRLRSRPSPWCSSSRLCVRPKMASRSRMITERLTRKSAKVMLTTSEIKSTRAAGDKDAEMSADGLRGNFERHLRQNSCQGSLQRYRPRPLLCAGLGRAGPAGRSMDLYSADASQEERQETLLLIA